MRAEKGLAILAVSAAMLAVFSFYWVGCGSNETLPATFQGNVSNVSGALARAVSRPRLFAAAERLVDPQALAACNAKAVLVCVRTVHGSGSPVVDCSRVNSTSCDFAAEMRLAANGDEVALSFVDDVNHNGAKDSGETEAALDNNLGSVCNGDAFSIQDVDVNFTTHTAHAASLRKDVDACPAPTPTRTGTRTTPSPTVTGTPPTATPTGTRPTATPTVTGTPPTATPTRTATPTCQLGPLCALLTPSPTRTP